MRKLTFIFIFCLFSNFAYSQKFEKPKLAGTWRLGFEDYQEFIYHAVEVFSLSYSKDDPTLKMVARLCSKEKMSVALANSDGFAYNFPSNAKYFGASTDGLFFARWSKCADRSEQYWYVPENSSFEYDELIAVGRVETKRFLATDYDKPNQRAAEKEFADYLQNFITELKNNPQAEGFILRNLKMNARKLREALKKIQNENIDARRLRILRKRAYDNFYPEFLTVAIKEK